jgi:hypothetical protein
MNALVVLIVCFLAIYGLADIVNGVSPPHVICAP